MDVFILVFIIAIIYIILLSDPEKQYQIDLGIFVGKVHYGLSTGWPKMLVNVVVHHANTTNLVVGA